MNYEPRRLLVVVKTYPNPSHSYGETVCCAGVDLESGRWVRMYPITFRRLAGKQFAKYQVIECQASKPSKGDYRPESLRIDQDTITLVGRPLPADAKGWQRRMALLPEPAQSVEAVIAAEEQSTKRSNATSTPPRRSSAGAVPPRSRPPARRPPA